MDFDFVKENAVHCTLNLYSEDIQRNSETNC